MRRPLVAVLLLLAASPALAAQKPGSSRSGSSSSSLGSSPGPGGQSLSGWFVLDPGPVDGVGIGGRVAIPLAPAGVLHSPRVRDDFTLELGADFVHYAMKVTVPDYYYSYPYYGSHTEDYSWNGLLAVGGVAWNFWLTPRFALYPKIDLGYFFGWYSGWNDAWGPYGRSSFGGLFLQGAGGLMYRFQTMSLRIELGSGLLRAGLGMSF